MSFQGLFPYRYCKVVIIRHSQTPEDGSMGLINSFLAETCSLFENWCGLAVKAKEQMTTFRWI